MLSLNAFEEYQNVFLVFLLLWSAQNMYLDLFICKLLCHQRTEAVVSQAARDLDVLFVIKHLFDKNFNSKKNNVNLYFSIVRLEPIKRSF